MIVVDTGNYYPSFRDGTIEEIESGLTESGWVAKHLGRPVVKVFNNIMAHSLAEGGLPQGAKGRIALPVAGDDSRAKAVVIGLVDALGFDGIDAGTLDESWRQQPGTPVYCTDYDADGVRRALSVADRGPVHPDSTMMCRQAATIRRTTCLGFSPSTWPNRASSRSPTRAMASAVSASFPAGKARKTRNEETARSAPPTSSRASEWNGSQWNLRASSGMTAIQPMKATSVADTQTRSQTL